MNHEEMMKHIALPEDFEKPRMRGDIDGNAFSVVGHTKKALRKAGHSDIADRLGEVAMQGDYNALLATCSACVEFVFPEYDLDEMDEEEEARYAEDDNA